MSMISWFRVNPIGVFLAPVIYLLVGMLFYTHWLLGRFWPGLVAHMQKKAIGIPSKIYIGTCLSAAVIAYVMGCFMNIARAKSAFSGGLIGFLIWIGFIIPTTFSPVLFGKKPLEMFWLDAIYYFIIYVSIGIMTAQFNRVY